MAAGVKHYFKDGREHKGATHKDAKGRIMSGAVHTASSKNLFHKKNCRYPKEDSSKDCKV
jgi:hypothetical protein